MLQLLGMLHFLEERRALQKVINERKIRQNTSLESEYSTEKQGWMSPETVTSVTSVTQNEKRNADSETVNKAK
jgi:hypothetical protein